MTVLLYTSARGKHIVFDDWTYDSYEDKHGNPVPYAWVGMCPSCHHKYRGILGNRCDNTGSGACSVKGCEQMADWYVDFSADEVQEERVEDMEYYVGRKVAHAW